MRTTDSVTVSAIAMNASDSDVALRTASRVAGGVDAGSAVTIGAESERSATPATAPPSATMPTRARTRNLLRCGVASMASCRGKSLDSKVDGGRGQIQPAYVGVDPERATGLSSR